MSIKISQLPVATSPVAPSAVLPVVQDGLTKKASIDQLGFLQSGTGATTRTIQNKLRDTVSVKDFGALGDGVADDTAAIQLALTYANGKPILIEDGAIFRLTSQVSTSNGVWLYGGGSIIVDFAGIESRSL